MKITFINPVIGGDYSALDIAITTLATILEKSRHKVKILDFTFHRRNWKSLLRKHISEFKPDIVGFSVNDLYLGHIKKISTEIKKINPKIKIIYGGYTASTKPFMLVKYPFVDFVFHGDADDKIVPLLDAIEKGKDLEHFPGLWFMKGNKLIKNLGSFFNDLDSLPYLDWDLWEDLDKYLYFLGMIYFEGSRGCIYNCSFCEAKDMRDNVPGKYYRVMSAKRFAHELAYQWKKYEKRGLRLMQIFDQIPTLSLEWVKEFTEEYKKIIDPKTHPYSMFSRVDNLSEEKIKLLANAGCNRLRIGIESGDEYIRNEVMRKSLTDKKIKEVVPLLKKYGINITAYYILGSPGETKETMQKTLNVAKWVDASTSAFFIFKPFTFESQVLIKKYGGKVLVKRNADNITFDAVVSYPDLSTRDIVNAQLFAYSRAVFKRIKLMWKRDGFMYIPHLISYITKGLAYGLDIKYLLPYFHIYSYNYILD